MLHISTTKRSLGLWASALCLLAACDDSLVTPNPDPASVTMPTCGGMPAEVLSGTITQNKTLTADKRWLLSGQVKVTQKATLTIEPGTTVCGDATDPQKVSFLNIDQDAKLVADGSREKPIVFTSSRKPGERRTSDWGGVVLRGRAPINLPPGDGSACGSLEGNAGSYGPCGTLRSDDSSGVLRYVRIEFAGREVAPDNELNGLTFGGVGSGTVIDYVQVHRGSDDAFEFFGGTVNVRHLVATGALDDSFDWDQGYSGKGQFLVSQQILADGSGSEPMLRTRGLLEGVVVQFRVGVGEKWWQRIAADEKGDQHNQCGYRRSVAAEASEHQRSARDEFAHVTRTRGSSAA